jgi:hypothetical protein
LTKTAEFQFFSASKLRRCGEKKREEDNVQINVSKKSSRVFLGHTNRSPEKPHEMHVMKAINFALQLAIASHIHAEKR